MKTSLFFGKMQERIKGPLPLIGFTYSGEMVVRELFIM